MFGVTYSGDAAIAREIANRAIDDWEAIIADFDFDGDNDPDTNNTYTLTISADTFTGGLRGRTENFTFNGNGIPVSADITLDDNAGGGGWFFDQTPFDDAEFTAVANAGANGAADAFQASFVDFTTGGVNYNDFYRTVLHEIGHAVGIVGGGALDDPNNNFLTFAGFDQGIGGGTLFEFHNPNGEFGVTATLTTNGGAHIYEGPADPNFPNAPTHPNDLMNPGRTVPPTGGDPIPTTRQFISDLDVQVLADAYGYTVVLPSTLDTAHVTLDSLSGTLLVQGRTGGQDDDIDIDIVGDDIRVQVNGTEERVARAEVTQIILARNGGTDSLTIDTELESLLREVHYVVSSNEDSADAGTLGDGLVDLDPVVPGNQVALRAAIRDINGGSTPGSIYVPRGNYGLTLNGPESSSTNDLDITTNAVTVIGAGPGLTVIDASGLTAGSNSRIFHVTGASAALDLSGLTLTGGVLASGYTGGAIFVSNSELTISDVAFIGNAANSGGAIRVAGSSALATIRRSVFVGNTASNAGGAIYSGNHSTLVVGESVFAGNSGPGSGSHHNVFSHATATFLNEGNNLVDDNQSNLFGAAYGDHIDETIDPGDLAVVTGIVDEIDPLNNAHAFSLREAVIAANTSGDTIWLPAWRLRLTRIGPESEETNDLDITGVVTIVGTGPGLTVVDASGLNADGIGGQDRVFQVAGSTAVLDLSRVTLTGGNVNVGSGTGGAIHVADGELTLTDAALVENAAVSGGAIRVSGEDAEATIRRSVFVGNTASNAGGAIYQGDQASSLLVGQSVFAGNSGTSSHDNVFSHATADFVNEGNNLVDDNQSDLFDADYGDHIDETTPSVDLVVVTTIDDEIDASDDILATSLREAVIAANSGNDTVWLPAWLLRLTLTGTDLGDASLNDLDITGTVTIVGTGAGLTVLDASGLNNDGIHGRDRHFEVASSGSLDLSRVTLTGGNVGTSTGGAIFVSDGELTLSDAALVGNAAASGGAIRVSGEDAEATIRRSVFVGNTASNAGGAIYQGDQASSVLVGQSVFAGNSGGTNGHNSVFNHAQATFVNEGNNLDDDEEDSVFDPAFGDHIATTTPEYVVTSVADSYYDGHSGYAMSVREAVDLATAGGDEIWLPGWNFVLTRDRETYGTGTTDMTAAFGDLDVVASLTIRGVASETAVAWRSGVVDAVFDLLGDYNSDGQVDYNNVSAADKTIWRDTLGSGSVDPANWELYAADGDDDGDVDGDDYNVWVSHFGNVLTLSGIS